MTSIIWREAWKYGERAFCAYCQHDTGHAIGALRFAAAMLGWRMQLLPEWSDAQIATLLGLDRLRTSGCRARGAGVRGVGHFAAGLRGSGFGIRAGGSRRRCTERFVVRTRQSPEPRPSRLAHIDEVTLATRYPGITGSGIRVRHAESRTSNPRSQSRIPGTAVRSPRDVILQRRSALAFDPRGMLPRFLLCHAPSSSAGRAAVGRHRVAAARSSRAVRASRAGRHAWRLRVRSRPGCADEWKPRCVPSFSGRKSRTGCFSFCRLKRATSPTGCRAIRTSPKRGFSASA